MPIHSLKKLFGPGLFLCGAALCYGALALSGRISSHLGEPDREASAKTREYATEMPSEFCGRTQPAPGRSGTIAPTVLHPVTEVLVTLGDRVKKDQPLVKIDDDEPQADVRAKKAIWAEMKASLARFKAQPREQERAEARAALQSTGVSLKEARRFLERVEQLWEQGAVAEARYFEARASRDRLEADERAAKARLDRLLKLPIQQEITELEAKIATAKGNLDNAIAELEHYRVDAPLAGVVSRLAVTPGMVSRPGTTDWGEILDLSEIDVRCDLTPEQADRVAVNQPAEVLQPGKRWPGKVAFVGLAADARGRIPILIRVRNPQENLRCYVDVKVRLVAGN